MMYYVRLFLVLICIGPSVASAQVNAYLVTQSLATYSPITGTVIDSLNEDDVFHNNIPIGFSFNYNGNITDRVGICTNGFIVMDSLNHSALWTPTNGSINQINVLMANLINTNANGNIQYTTTGTAPNRVFVVQWKEYSVVGATFCKLNAQVRLFEGTNCIQLCYGTNVLSGNAGKSFNVGLVGNNNLDYNLRTGNFDWLNSNKSTSYPGAGLFLNPLVNVPAGLVYTYGTCTAPGVPYYYIRGSVFKDVNNNGIRDGGEFGIPNITVFDSLQAEFTNTDINGDYTLAFHDSMQFYRVKVVSPDYWTISSTPASFTLYPDTQSVINRDFGLYPLPYKYDIRISSSALNAPGPGKNVTFSTSYQNIGTALLPGDTIFLTKDPRYSFVNAIPSPDLISGDTIAWVYSNLQIEEYRHILVTLLTANTVVNSDTLHSTWLAKPMVNDTVTSNNQITLHQRVNEIILPNGKTVTPEGTTMPGTELTYTIRFQNTSNGIIPENIIVRDTLNTNLDVSTFHLLGATHPVTYNLLANGILQFTFAGIYLPDSNTNEPGSHGAVSFTIKPKSGLPANTVITNRASISFDFLPAIQTNTTQNIMVSPWPNALESLSAPWSATIYPNPTTSKLYIHATQPLGKTSLCLYNQIGSLVRHETPTIYDTASIDMSSLPAGLYYLAINTSMGTRVVRVVRQ